MSTTRQSSRKRQLRASQDQRTPPRTGPRRSPSRRLAQVWQAQPVGALVAKLIGPARTLKVLFANRSLCAMLGRTARELADQPQRVLPAAEADVAEWQRWIATAKAGETFTGDGYLRHKDGSLVNAVWSFVPLANRRGRMDHVVVNFFDQTERRQRIDTLVQTQRLDAVEHLAGSVAHDFNNLLSVINGYCEMLAPRLGGDPKALRELTEIHDTAQKATVLAQRLLTFSKRQPFDARVVNLNALLEANAAVLQRLVGNAGRLEFDLASALPNVRTDPAQFQQVVINLVLNARDALRDNGRITIGTACRAIRPEGHRRVGDLPPGHYVVLAVRDNGTGMDAETQRRLFEPFFTTKAKGKGTGLGLAQVYGVVQASHGDIVVRSELLAGSTFEVLLPATTEEVVETAPAVVAPLPSVRGHEEVALIENDGVLRKMVAGILTADGYSVAEAESWAELARRPASARPVQLLIAPPSPEASRGARTLRQRNPALRVLCVQPSERAPTRVAGVPAEAQAHLAKPYALSELVRAARRLLDGAGGPR